MEMDMEWDWEPDLLNIVQDNPVWNQQFTETKAKLEGLEEEQILSIITIEDLIRVFPEAIDLSSNMRVRIRTPSAIEPSKRGLPLRSRVKGKDYYVINTSLLILMDNNPQEKAKEIFGDKLKELFPSVAFPARQNQLQIPQGVRGDRAFGNDSLGVQDELEALAQVLMLRSVFPPLAIGLLGSWGSGKSFGMHLIQQKINDIRAEKIDDDQAWGEKPSPYVGHIYSITFNAWTYAKENLWASLMQEIFYELNRQIGLERRLAELLAETTTPVSTEEKPVSTEEKRAIDRFIYQPWQWFKAQIWRPIRLFALRVGRVVDLAIVQPICHVRGFLPFLIILIAQLRADGVKTIYRELENQLTGQSGDSSESTEKSGQASRSTQYYWRDEIPPETNRLETVIERVLYLLLLGFPERLKDTQTRWDKKINPATKPTPEEIASLLREGGSFWSILYELDPAKRTKEINNEINNKNLGKRSEEFNAQPGYLWQILDKLRQSEQQKLQTLKKQRDKREIELQKLLKTEGDRRKLIALFKPIVQKLAKLTPDELSAIGTPLGFLAIVLFVAATTVLAQQTDAIANFVASVTDAIANLATEIAKLPAIRYIGLVSTAIAILPKLIGYINAVKEELRAIKLDPEHLFDDDSGTSEKGKKLNAELATLRLEVKEQEERAGFTANHSSVVDFVNARLNTDTYGKHLGLMQQVRRDLEDLSQGFTSDPDRLKEIFPRGPVRVVLYIDDLDRCPPDRVVEVLEAVQLLLKTPLFIVVLAIDDRYIARALEQVYKGVLKRKGKPSGIDYLEKIIQIPYRMRPIAPHTIKDYLESQTEVQEEEKAEPEANSDPNQDLPPVQGTDRPTNDAPKSSDPSSEPAIEQSDTKEQTTTDPESEPENVIETIKLDREEFHILVDCCKHVDVTPRTAKRLINIYKILQIIWHTRNTKNPNYQTFETQDKRTVMSFLALSGRYPELMRYLFEEIDVLLEEDAGQYVDRTDYDNPRLSIPLNVLLDDKLSYAQNSRDPYAKREWKRFEGDIKRMVSSYRLSIDRETFELMISFCFVGDIGYDPDDRDIDRDIENHTPPSPRAHLSFGGALRGSQGAGSPGAGRGRLTGGCGQNPLIVSGPVGAKHSGDKL
ncbi:MAG: P-loop NTPase fold protein [Hormoscilla sp.]